MTPEDLNLQIDRVYREVCDAFSEGFRLSEFGRRMYELGVSGTGEGWQRLGDELPAVGSPILIKHPNGRYEHGKLAEQMGSFAMDYCLVGPDDRQLGWDRDALWKYFY